LIFNQVFVHSSHSTNRIDLGPHNLSIWCTNQNLC